MMRGWMRTGRSAMELNRGERFTGCRDLGIKAYIRYTLSVHVTGLHQNNIQSLVGLSCLPGKLFIYSKNIPRVKLYHTPDGGFHGGT